MALDVPEKRNAKFGDLLNGHLQRKERSESWLANHLEMSPSTVNNWCNKKTRPGDAETVHKIAEALELDEDSRKKLFEAAGYKYYPNVILSPSASSDQPKDRSDDVSEETKLDASEQEVESDDKQLRQARPKWAVWGVSVPVLIILAVWLRGLFSPSVAPPVAQQTSAPTTTDSAAIASPLAVASLATATPVVTPTATPIPVFPSILTPTPVPTAKPDETLILIATFYSTGADNLVPHIKIKREIEKKIKSLQLNNVRVAVAPTELDADQRTEAEALGRWYNASMVIWGEDTRGQVLVNYLSLQWSLPESGSTVTFEPRPEAAKIDTNEQESTEQLEDTGVYHRFIIDDLPGQITFLSLFTIGQMHYTFGDQSLAIPVIEEAIASLNSESQSKMEGLPEAYLFLGSLYQLYVPENLDKAIEYLNKAIALNPNLSLAYSTRANVHGRQEDWKDAIKDYTKAIEVYNPAEIYKAHFADYEDPAKVKIIQDPILAGMYYERGAIYSKQNDLEDAIKDYTKAIELYPKDPDFYYDRGIDNAALGKMDDAIADYTKAIELDPHNDDAYNNRGVAFTVENNLSDAIKDFDRAIELDPNNADSYHNRATVHLRQSDWESAIEDYSKAIELKPDYAQFYLSRGVAYYRHNVLDKAIKDFTKAIELDPTNDEFYTYRGDVNREQHNWESAIKDFTKAIELKPDYAYAYLGRGVAYASQGEYKEAIKDYDKVIQFDPNNDNAYYNRAVAYGMQGEIKKAIEDYNKAIQLNPDFADAYGNRGFAHKATGNLQQALSDFRRYLELDPDTQYKAEVEQDIAKIEAELAE